MQAGFGDGLGKKEQIQHLSSKEILELKLTLCIAQELAP